MKETRRLDILAAIGGVLAMVILTNFGILGYRYHSSNHFDEYWAREAILKNARQPATRAALDVMLKSPSLSFQLDPSKLKKAAKEYPNDPRLNLYMGVFAEEPIASEALEHLSKLDPNNALLIYLLASKASSRGDWGEARSLLAKADELKGFDCYDFPYAMANGDFGLECQLSQANSDGAERVQHDLRKLAKGTCDHALKLHAAGRDHEALAILKEIRQLGWRPIRRDGADIIDALRGSAIVRTSDDARTQIASDIGDGKVLADAGAEIEKTILIRAGTRAFVLEDAYDPSDRMIRLVFTGIIAFWVLVACSMALIMNLIGLGVMLRKSRGLQVSPMHAEATTKAYSAANLIKVYAVAFVVPFLAFLAMTIIDPGSHWFAAVTCIAMFSMVIVPMGLNAHISKRYEKAYSALAQEASLEPLPKSKLMAAQDKRELLRRDAGLLGGFLITLSFSILVLSTALRLHFGAYPCQITKAMGGMPQAEMRYVKDLVDGKVKVPQKYIDEIKREEARINAQHSTKSAGERK